MTETPNARSPSHISIFTRFFDSTPSRLEALIAFGIFTESERKASLETSRHYSEYQDRLFAANKDFCLDGAKIALLNVCNEAIEKRKAEILEAALGEFKSEAKIRHRAFRLAGVWEAVLGAALWSIILIAIGFGAVYLKPDLIEVPRNVIERQQQSQPHQ